MSKLEFRRCVFIILVIVILYAVSFWLGRSSPQRRSGKLDTCERILLAGHAVSQRSSFVDWAPRGCRLRDYSPVETDECFRRIRQSLHHADFRVSFIGDSRVRQLRDSLSRQVTGIDVDWLANDSIHYSEAVYKKHLDLSFQLGSSNLTVAFTWLDLIEKGTVDTFLNDTLASSRPPMLIIMGFGLWQIRNCYLLKTPVELCLQTYRQFLQRYKPNIQKLAGKTRFIWHLQSLIARGKLLRCRFDHTPYNDRDIIRFNDAARTILGNTNVVFWESLYDATNTLGDGLDDCHIGPQSRDYAARALTNYMCNQVYADQNDESLCCTNLTSSSRPILP